MIREVNALPLAFERALIEEMAESLEKHGFVYEEPVPDDRNHNVSFKRKREGHQEEIAFYRYTYDEDYKKTGIYDGIEFDKNGNYLPVENRVPTADEVEREPKVWADKLYWVSRHRMGVQFFFDTGEINLRTNGQATGTKWDDDWWYFIDEPDLRLRLREIFMLIETSGLQWFDDRLEDNQSDESKQWKAFQQREQEKISKAVAELGNTYTEQQYKAAVLGAMEKVYAEAAQEATESD